MIIENTEENKKIQRVAATMAIENMYLSQAFINDVVQVTKGEKTYDELRQEIINAYANRKEKQ